MTDDLAQSIANLGAVLFCGTLAYYAFRRRPRVEIQEHDEYWHDDFNPGLAARWKSPDDPGVGYDHTPAQGKMK